MTTALKATLLIINGPGRGTRFEVYSDDGDLTIGRSVGTRIRVTDTEVSRQHAKISYDGTQFLITDLSSVNGTFVNGERCVEHNLKSNDTIRVGRTRMTFRVVGERPEHSESVANVRFLEDSPSDHASAIVQQVVAERGSSVAVFPDRSGLDLLYQVAEELVRPVEHYEDQLERILNLTLRTIGADRGCLLLRDSAGGTLEPVVLARSQSSKAESNDEQMTISRSITNYVLQHGKAVRTSNASTDDRFSGGHSIVSCGIREAICAPLRGQEEIIGVLYLDTTLAHIPGDRTTHTDRLTEEHLKSVLAVARQTALAVESRRFHEAMLTAERFASMGQTVAVLSHHIKNILQGIGGAGYLVRTGIDKSDPDMIRQGWNIIERNQKRIGDLVADMLSFSKDRVPELTTGNINRLCEDVLELARSTAAENKVKIEFRRGEVVPASEFDPEGMHRALLNIVMNAIDAVSERDDGKVVIQTGYDHAGGVMMIAVTDNGPGIPEEQREVIFKAFESSKGSRGTGIGLPVSRKIVREHGGQIRIEGGPGEGTRFVLSWPRGNPSHSEHATVQLDSMTQPDLGQGI